MISIDTLTRRLETYHNTGDRNDLIHQEFTQLVGSIPWLQSHRKHIEANQLGFGDAAFHYMWYLLIQDIAKRVDRPKLLEIVVYKGQVISLWALIAAQLKLEVEISGISPLQGNELPKSEWLIRWKKLIDPQFRREARAGNFYPEDNYRQIIENLFKTFNLDFASVRLIQGYSNQPDVLNSIEKEKFSLIYIDGDHTFEVVKQDIDNYSSHIEPGGFLVMDDAAYYIPGSTFSKGQESVSSACEIIPSLGFANVLNIGHNRIYQKIRS